MQPVEFEGSRMIQKPENMTDNQCMAAWCITGIDVEGFPYYVTAWKPSYEDLQALNRGEPIYVKVIGNGLPPMAIFTMDENGNCNDA